MKQNEMEQNKDKNKTNQLNMYTVISLEKNMHINKTPGARFRKEVEWKLWVCKPWNEGNSGFPFQKWEVWQTRESRVSQARFWKRGNLYSVTLVTYCGKPNMVASRFSSVNPEFISFSSPFLYC